MSLPPHGPAIRVSEGERVSGLDDALGANIKSVDKPADLVRAVIQFANGEIAPHWATRSPEWREGPLIGDNNGEYFEIHPTDEDVAAAEAQIEHERAYATEALEHAVKGALSLVKFLRTATRNGNRTNVRLEPALRIKNGRHVQIRWSYFGPTGESRGWVLFAAGLIAEKANGDRTDVGRCRLDSCGKFFVIERGKLGKPRTEYCCDTHRLEAHNLNAAARQRRARGKRKERAAQPKRTRR